ncbi:MAG: amino acid adenylation domain-containing protein [Chloroflexi bacterium]|nr:MAG: amino acid adenylation domain-containing protein [Chloroflexota bacterium]
MGKPLWLPWTRTLNVAEVSDPTTCHNPTNSSTAQNLAYIMYTSGSTGTPKGVGVVHQNIVRLIASTNYVTWEPSEILLQLAPLSFDASTFEIWGALLSGLSLIIFPTEPVALSEIGRVIERYHVTILWLTAGLFHQMVEHQRSQLASVRQLFAGGEVLSVPHVQHMLETLTDGRLIDGYGPTENTTFTCCHVMDRECSLQGSVPIGRPISNTQVYVLDAWYQPVPLGAIGELYVGGDGLARGYFNRPDLTAERFVPHPFVAAQFITPGARLYRTGDQVRYRPDGTLEYLGRIDQQVKLRGFRIELGEIEATLRAYPDVQAAVVVLHNDDEHGKVLIAYVVTHKEKPLTTEALQEHLHKYLPDYMVPTSFVFLDTLPLTPNGKVDRKALPALDQSLLLGNTEMVVPQTAIQAQLATIWADLLHLPQVGIQHNFFTLGGHSLLATQLMVQLQGAFNVKVPLRSLFEAPTIAQLAVVIEQLQAESKGQEHQLKLSILLQKRDGSALPLSFAQERLWFLHQWAEDSAWYNVPMACRLSGSLQVAALERSLRAVVQRHEVLRTTFSLEEGLPMQVIAPDFTLRIPVIDLRQCPAQDQQVEQLARTEVLRPFDLSAGPLLRVCLLQLREQEHILLFTLHHILTDGWSMGVLLRELSALYQAQLKGRPAPLPALPIQYADYAIWQRQWLQGEVLQDQLVYWQQQLSGAPALLELPTDRPRPAVQTDAGALQTRILPPALLHELKRVSQREGVTLFMTLLAAFQGLLMRYSGQQDIVVGTPIANRGQAGLENLIGFFANTLVLRTDLSGNPGFRQLLARVREVALQAYMHQDLPFEKLVESLQVERSLSHSPLFQVFFSLRNAAETDIQLTGLTWSEVDRGHFTSQFDLSLMLVEGENGLLAELEYNTDLFDAATITRLLSHWQVLLEAIVHDPEQAIEILPLLTPEERTQLLVQSSADQCDYPRELYIHQLFEQQAALAPEAIAVIYQQAALTYRELNARANQLANYLRAKGIGPEKLVGVCIPHSLELVIALLAVLKAGGAYLPLDPNYPTERLNWILTDTRPSLVLTQQRFLTRLPREQWTVCLDQTWRTLTTESRTNPASITQGEHTAYVIYTSGSTGTPKGVMISQHNVMNFLQGMDGRFDSSLGIWLAITSISFDISVLELFWTLTRGFQVVLYTPSHKASPSLERAEPHVEKELAFSLFYFASDAAGGTTDRYRLLLEGAKFADQHGFEALWTPERHFYDFGGLYPNPVVTSAAVAAVTQRLHIRAGSVVLPLHNPIRITEEWAVVDNLSHGRVGIAFASGWHAHDFVFAPDKYVQRKEIMQQDIETVHKLWRGETITVQGGTGDPITVRTLPRPVQAELPVWITSGGSTETFRMAGEIGASVLTHLLGQDLEQLADKIAVYREEWHQHGHDAQGEAGHVTLMLHTFIGTDLETVRETVRQPFHSYLRSSIDLLRPLARSMGLDSDINTLHEDDMQALLDFAFERYFASSGLMGTIDSCLPMIENLRMIGVDELACLIDFGVAVEDVLASLRDLDELKERANAGDASVDLRHLEELKGRAHAIDAPSEREASLSTQLLEYGITHLQCAPSFMNMLLTDPEAIASKHGGSQTA